MNTELSNDTVSPESIGTARGDCGVPSKMQWTAPTLTRLALSQTAVAASTNVDSDGLS